MNYFRQLGKRYILNWHREFIRTNGEFVSYSVKYDVCTEIYKFNGKRIAFCYGKIKGEG